MTYTRTQIIAGGLALLAAFLFVVEIISLALLWAIDQNTQQYRTHNFLARYLLTRPFAPEVVPGKRFIGTLNETATYRDFLLADPLLGWRLAANIAAIRRGGTLYTTDSNGFITEPDDPPVEIQKPAGTYRIVVMGASGVMGHRESRASENLVGRLREYAAKSRLQGPHKATIEFINAGVAGYQSGQEYLYLYNDLLRYSPDLVVLYNGSNDIANYGEEYLHGAEASPLRTRTHVEMTERIRQSYDIRGATVHLLSALGHSLSGLKRSVGMIELPWRAFRWATSSTPARPQRDTPAYVKVSARFYEQNLRADVALAKSQGLSMAIFLQPLAGIDGKVLTPEERTSMGQLLDAIRVQREHFYQDARNTFARLRSENQSPQFCIEDISRTFEDSSETVYSDPAHLLPNGTSIVARHLLAKLVNCGQLVQP